jgi:hypothetical protein
MKMYGGVKVQLHTLTSAPDGDEWSTSCPSHFNPNETALSTHMIGGWVGPRASVDMVVKRKKNPFPCQELNSQPTHRLVTIWTKLLWLKKKIKPEHINGRTWDHKSQASEKKRTNSLAVINFYL